MKINVSLNYIPAFTADVFEDEKLRVYKAITLTVMSNLSRK